MDGWVWVLLTLIGVLGAVLLWRGGQLSVKCKSEEKAFEFDYQEHPSKKPPARKRK